MSNLELWNKVCRPPKEALKTIKGGRLAGMTDINPQWRFKAMTEQFGPCGVGWSYTIEKLWTEPGPDGQVMAFAQISLQVKGTLTNAPQTTIPGIGGSTLVAKEKDGLRGNDEAYKMAVTDALSVAMKALGVGAEIYMGLWDGTKYREAPTSAHSGTDGAFEGLSTDMQTFVKDTADEVLKFMKAGKVTEAVNRITAANFDAESEVAFWAVLQPYSGERSAIKKKQAEMRGKATEGLKNMKDDIP